MTAEAPEARRKRLAMRSMRRGIKEMDLILSAYARDRLAAMGEADLRNYDALLSENDQDLYSWITGQTPVPDEYSTMISDISEHTRKA